MCVLMNAVTNVTVINAAVCADVCTATVYLHDACNLGGTTIVPSVASRRDAAREAVVPGLPLTGLVPENAILRARLIKIDVEGAEWPVIQGFASLLPRLSARTELLIEVSTQALSDHGVSLASFIDLFQSAGFHPFVIGNRYNVDMYLEPVAANPVPWDGQTFDQIDFLFRRV